MAIKTAGELRALRDKKKKPVRFKVELTMDQILASIILLKRVEYVGDGLSEETKNSAREAIVRLQNRIKGVLFMPEPKAESAPSRKYLCSSCVSSVVVYAGARCIDCSGDDGGDRVA